MCGTSDAARVILVNLSRRKEKHTWAALMEPLGEKYQISSPSLRVAKSQNHHRTRFGTPTECRSRVCICDVRHCLRTRWREKKEEKKECKDLGDKDSLKYSCGRVIFGWIWHRSTDLFPEDGLPQVSGGADPTFQNLAPLPFLLPEQMLSLAPTMMTGCGSSPGKLDRLTDSMEVLTFRPCQDLPSHFHQRIQQGPADSQLEPKKLVQA